MWTSLLLATVLLVRAADGLPAQCYKNYAMPNQSERLITTQWDVAHKALCDSSLDAGLWYKYLGHQLAEHDPGPNVCQTQITGYLAETRPEKVGDNKTIKVCFHAGDPCHWSSHVQVTNCGSDYVYKFQPMRDCDLAYCFEPGTLTTTTFTTTTSNTSTTTSFSSYVSESCNVSLNRQREAQDKVTRAQQMLKLAQDELTVANDKVDFQCKLTSPKSSLNLLGDAGMTMASPVLISAVVGATATVAIVLVAKWRRYSWSVHVTSPLLPE